MSPFILYAALLLLLVIAAATTAQAVVAVLLYARLKGIDLRRLEIEIWHIWRKRQERKRPLGL